MRFTLTACTALAVVLGFGGSAFAAGSEGAATSSATFQPIPAVSTAAAQQTAHSTTTGSTSSTPRYYYYPSYNYQQGTSTVSQTPQLYYVPSSGTQQRTTPTTTAAPRVVSPVRTPVVRRPLNNLARGYLSLKGMYSEPKSYAYTTSATPDAAVLDLEDNFAILGAFGGNLGNFGDFLSPRAEFEGGYRSYNAESIAIAAAAPVAADGDVQIYSGMANIYQDFILGPVRPYVGVGAGIAHLKFNDISDGATDPGSIDDSSTTWAIQGMVGINFDVTPNFAIGVEARRFEARNVEIDSNALRSENDLKVNEYGAGITLRF